MLRKGVPGPETKTCAALLVSVAPGPDGVTTCVRGHSFRPSTFQAAPARPAPLPDRPPPALVAAPPTGPLPAALRSVWQVILYQTEDDAVLPADARLLHVGLLPVRKVRPLAELWYEASGEPAVRREYRIVESGQPTIGPTWTYLGTAIGDLARHVYEVPRVAGS